MRHKERSWHSTWISNLFFSEVTLTCYSLRNNSILYNVWLGGWSQYKAHCKHNSVVSTIEKTVINWKTTLSWGKVKDRGNTGCIGCLVTVFHSQNQILMCWYEDITGIYQHILRMCTWLYLSDTLLQFICYLCGFHKTFALSEGFRYGFAWMV